MTIIPFYAAISTTQAFPMEPPHDTGHGMNFMADATQTATRTSHFTESRYVVSKVDTFYTGYHDVQNQGADA